MSLLEGYRLFTGYYIYESEMDSNLKLEFIRFLKEASADDIVDILSGKYEGVTGLTEAEMKACNTFLEERFGMKYVAKGAKAAVKGAEKVKGAAVKGAGKVKGAAVAGAGKVKGAAVKGAGKVKGAGVAVGAGAKKAYGKTFHTAMGRTALAGAGGAAAGAGGVAGYQKLKKK